MARGILHHLLPLLLLLRCSRAWAAAAPAAVVRAPAGNNCTEGYQKIPSLPLCVASLDLLGKNADRFRGGENEDVWPGGCYLCEGGVPGCQNGFWYNSGFPGAANGDAAPICATEAFVNPEAGRSLWMGDSDMDYWANTSELDIGSHNVGVAGDTCKDTLGDLDSMLTAFDPSVLVVVCGENDLASDVSVAKTFSRFKKIVEAANTEGVRVIYMGTKNEPSTRGLWDEYAAYDRKIRKYAKELASEQPRGDTNATLTMIDVNAAFRAIGNPRNLYRRDRLHLSPKGYGIWDGWILEALADDSCALWKNGDCKWRAGGDPCANYKKKRCARTGSCKWRPNKNECVSDSFTPRRRSGGIN